MTLSAAFLGQTEIGLVVLALACLILDVVLPARTDRGRTLAVIAMAGIAVLFANLFRQWGAFGIAIKGTFVQDGFALVLKGLFLAAGFLTLAMGRDYGDQFKRGRGEFTLLVLFALIGMSFLASANDFLLLFVALETLTISVYVMTAYLREQHASIEAGVKYLVLGALSTALFLYGLSYVYGAAGQTQFAAVAGGLTHGALPPAYLFGTALIVAALAFKIAAVPFQLWVPDIYQGAPTPVASFLAVGSKAAGMAALLRLSLSAFAPASAKLEILFAVLAALTIVYGNLGSLPQTNLKRLLGYSSIGHAGYLLIGLATLGAGGGQAVLVYLAAYFFGTGGAFLVLVILSRHLKRDEISELGGLSLRSPILAAAMLLSLLSLAGVPPLAGFFAKFYLLWASVKAGLLWLTFVGVLNVITSLYYYLKVVKAMYLDAPSDTAPIRVTRSQTVLLAAMILGVLILGVWQNPLVRLSGGALRTFLF